MITEQVVCHYVSPVLNGISAYNKKDKGRCVTDRRMLALVQQQPGVRREYVLRDQRCAVAQQAGAVAAHETQLRLLLACPVRKKDKVTWANQMFSVTSTLWKHRTHYGLHLLQDEEVIIAPAGNHSDRSASNSIRDSLGTFCCTRSGHRRDARQLSAKPNRTHDAGQTARWMSPWLQVRSTILPHTIAICLESPCLTHLKSWAIVYTTVSATGSVVRRHVVITACNPLSQGAEDIQLRVASERAKSEPI